MRCLRGENGIGAAVRSGISSGLSGPPIAAFACAFIGIGKPFGGRYLDRFWKTFCNFGRSNGRKCADLAHAFPLEEAAERTQARQGPHQRASGNIVGPAHRHEGSDIAGFQCCKSRKCHLRAPMPAEKGEALPDVAGIGLQGFWRQPPLGAQMRQPARHLKRGRAIGAVEFDRLNGGKRFGHELSGRDDSRHYIASLSFTVR